MSSTAPLWPFLINLRFSLTALRASDCRAGFDEEISVLWLIDDSMGEPISMLVFWYALFPTWLMRWDVASNFNTGIFDPECYIGTFYAYFL